ncbi:MAG: ATP-binding protein [Pirellulaceae bacterium]|nr:ATP-binding protein [Pirellulaceae bacterium]
MLEINENRSIKRLTFGLGLLSLVSMVVTAWVLLNVRHEQATVKRLLGHLEGMDLQLARELSSELVLQLGLVVLLVINLGATVVAFSFLLRGYLSSERNLKDIKVLSTDILASMDAGVITIDRNQRIISINPSGRQLIGLTLENPLQSIQTLGPEHSALAEICEEIDKTQQTIRDREYQTLRNGHRVILRAGGSVLRNRQNEEIGLVLHIRNVTAHFLMQERLRRMERYIGLGALAAGLQHEIKNPLSALSLHVQLLCERLQKETGDEEVNTILDVLKSEFKRIGDVLDGFRNYASIHEIGRTPVDVRKLIEKLSRLMRPDAEEKNVRIEIRPADDNIPMIQADANQLEQVLLNLAINGIAAMPGGGLLRFHVSNCDDMLRVDVSDSGTGIPEENQPLIFEPYFTTRKDGSGMGLALSEKIVRQHDGRIEFETSQEGTTFSVFLPTSASCSLEFGG